MEVGCWGWEWEVGELLEGEGLERGRDQRLWMNWMWMKVIWSE